jgi:hypothetical protein
MNNSWRIRAKSARASSTTARAVSPYTAARSNAPDGATHAARSPALTTVSSHHFSGRYSSRSISGPGPVRRQEHSDLAVLDPARRPRVLSLDAGRHPALLQETRLIGHQLSRRMPDPGPHVPGQRLLCARNYETMLNERITGTAARRKDKVMSRSRIAVTGLAMAAAALLIPAGAAEAGASRHDPLSASRQVATPRIGAPFGQALAGPARAASPRSISSASYKGCPVFDACMYTLSGWSSGHPEHKYYYYGCYDLSNEYGTRVIYNNQVGAFVYGYDSYGCGGNSAWVIPVGCACKVNISPINSISLSPTPPRAGALAGLRKRPGQGS